MKEVKIRDEFIKLGQAMKLSGAAESGTDAKERILNGEIRVNGEVCLMRGKKLYPGDVFTAEGEEYRVIS
ncbi:MAG: RNA-binding S4 domain-containing protein [Lachnospiraceae bacterium]|nr:RNA-binding S4 domain-containing protein [Lachnospiraceae bacterium]